MSDPLVVRVRYGDGQQARFRVASKAHAAVLRDLARDLAQTSQPPLVRRQVLNDAAGASPAELAAIQQLVSEWLTTPPDATSTKPVTFAELAEQWYTGALHKRYPDHVRRKRSHRDDESRLTKLAQVVGDVPIAAFTLADAERAMASLPADLKPATRRTYAQAMSKLLRLAVYPCRLRESSPLPVGFLPTNRSGSVYSWLYPDEDRLLMACRDVPLERRVLWGFLSRTGVRLGEALQMAWSDIDLVRGTITLLRTKTDDPRVFAADPSVVTALRRWRELSPSRPFHIPPAGHAPKVLRADLRTAGVTRAELFERSGTRQPLRVHDLRATFVTLALAAGKSETWVSDRTGHRSSAMIARYRRGARTAAELGIGQLAPLDEAVPELGGEGESAGESEGGPPRNAKRRKQHEKPCAPGPIRTADLRFRNSAQRVVPAPQPRKNGLVIGSDDSGKSRKVHVDSPLTQGAPPVFHPPTDSTSQSGPPVFHPLADALRRATEAGQWELASQIAALLAKG